MKERSGDGRKGGLMSSMGLKTFTDTNIGAPNKTTPNCTRTRVQDQEWGPKEVRDWSTKVPAWTSSSSTSYSSSGSSTLHVYLVSSADWSWSWSRC